MQRERNFHLSSLSLFSLTKQTEKQAEKCTFQHLSVSGFHYFVQFLKKKRTRDKCFQKVSLNRPYFLFCSVRFQNRFPGWNYSVLKRLSSHSFGFSIILGGYWNVVCIFTHFVLRKNRKHQLREFYAELIKTFFLLWPLLGKGSLYDIVLFWGL